MRKLLLIFILFPCIFKSQAQWESQVTGFNPSRGISQIVPVSQTVVWASGFDPASILNKCRDYCHTSDGGNTWTSATLTSAANASNWSCITAVDENNAWAMFNKTTGAGGSVWHTSDGGTTWTQQGAGQIYAGSTSFPDVMNFWDADTGVAVGDPLNGEFEIYTTVDGGATWTAVNGDSIPDPISGEYGFTRSIAVYKNVIWFGTNMGRLYKSTNRGLSWNVYDTGLSSDGIYQIVFIDEENGYVELYDGTGAFVSLLRTTDGGNTWTDISPSANFFVYYGLCYVPKTTNTLVSAGYDPITFVYGSSYSLDGGDTWTTIDDSVIHLAVSFYDNITGWSGDVNSDVSTGGMWKYSSGFVATGVENSNTNFKFNLYPNPGDGLFYFSFDAQNTEPIHIIITDAMGKIVFNQDYKDKSQTWLRSIDLRHLSKGVYFLKMENNGQQTSRKLVIE